MTSSNYGTPDETAVPETQLLSLSDEELADNVRTGSTDALAELWQRHSVFGLVAATGVAPGQAKELNERAWLILVEDILASGGPPAGFRPYLYLCVNQATGEIQPVSDASVRMTEAFFSLPTRWQEILWYLDVEQMGLGDATLLTNLNPDTITSTQARARRGLKEAWLHVNAQHAPEDSDCRWTLEHSRAYLKKTLPVRDNETFTKHVSGCESCRATIVTARTMSSQVSGLLLTGVAGAPAGTALATYLRENGPVVLNDDPPPDSVIAALVAGAAAPAAGAAAGAAGAAAVGAGAAVVGAAAVGAGAAGAGAAGAGAGAGAGAATGAGAAGSVWAKRIPAILLGVLAAVVIIGGTIMIASQTTGETGPTTPGVSTPTTSGPATPTEPGETTTPPPQTESPTAPPTTAPPTTTPPTTTPPPSPTTQSPPKTTPPPPSQTTQKPPPPPPPPHTTAPYKAASISGVDTGSKHTFYPVVTGTAEPGDKVTIKVGSKTFTETADARGDWSVSGPYTGLGAGSLKVTATGTKNTATATKTVTLVAPPTPSVSATASGVTVNLKGVAGASIQILANGQSVRLSKLDASGNGHFGLSLRPGTVVTARYFENGRFGPTSIQVTV